MFQTSLFPVLGILFLLIVSCDTTSAPSGSTFNSIHDPQVKDILQKSMKTMGDWNHWESKTSFVFRKKFMLYDSIGAIEQSTLQHHHYQFRPEKMITISWEKEDDQHQVVYKNNTFSKTINGKPDPSANQEKLSNSVFSSTFVMNIPWNLLDNGVQLAYEGRDTLENNLLVHTIKAIYHTVIDGQQTPPDIWWFYFDQTDFRLQAYMVKHTDHYSYVKNISYTQLNNFLLVNKRKSYRVDKNRNILYLRADYEYGEYKLELENVENSN